MKIVKYLTEISSPNIKYRIVFCIKILAIDAIVIWYGPNNAIGNTRCHGVRRNLQKQNLRVLGKIGFNMNKSVLVTEPALP